MSDEAGELTVGGPTVEGATTKQKVALGASAITAGASILAAVTGNADAVVHAPGKVAEAITRPIEAILPGVSSEYTTPKEVFDGTVDVRIHGLNGRTAPSTAANIVDWDDLKLVTSRFDSTNNKTYEDYLDLSGKEGFTIERPYFVEGQNPNGGHSENGSRWLKFQALKDGKKIDVYVSVSQQTSDHVTLNGNGTVEIDFAKVDGVDVVKPKDLSKHLPNGQLNHVVPLAPAAPISSSSNQK
jgi:hypothetical protein